MKRSAIICILSLLFISAERCVARTVSVSSASQVNKTWRAGDTLVFSSGTFQNQSLTIQGTGTAATPIVLRAQTSGKTVLTGSSTLTISGSYIEVSGLVFRGTYTGKNHIVQFATDATRCRLTECVIESYNPTDLTKDYKWVSIKGRENRVDHCLFENKTNIGTLLVVWLETGVIPKHRVDHNRFLTRSPLLDESGKELNGQEIIRIGDSSTSMQTAACVVEYNTFEECDGEIEIVSNKSCGNTYQGNVFRRSAGSLTLRHGNNCTVSENFFFGEGKSATGGVRIIGEGHVVQNNYFEALTGNNYRAAICIVRGKENSALNEYFQVKNAVVSGNVFVNCKEAMCVNYHSSSDCTMPSLNSRIDSNTVYNDTGNNYVLNLAATGGSLTFLANTYNTGKWKNYTPSEPAWLRNTQMSKPDAEQLGLPTTNVAATVIPIATKVIVDGQLIIEKDERQYNIFGQRIK